MDMKKYGSLPMLAAALALTWLLAGCGQSEGGQSAVTEPSVEAAEQEGNSVSKADNPAVGNGGSDTDSSAGGNNGGDTDSLAGGNNGSDMDSSAGGNSGSEADNPESGENETDGGESADIPQEDPLPSDEDLSWTIIDHNRGLYLDGEFAAESHVILASEQEDTPEGLLVTVYMMSLFETFDFPDGRPELVSGSSTPAAVSFYRTDSGQFRLASYWEPEDGAYWSSLREKFPASLSDSELDTQAYISQLTQACDAQAEAFAQNRA